MNKNDNQRMRLTWLLFKNALITLLQKKSLNINEGNKSNYLFQYLVSGCVSVIQNWINGSMQESPMEILELIYHTSVAVLESVKVEKEDSYAN